MKLKIRHKDKPPITISQEKTDPLCLRASIGGTAKQGYYIVFRGDNLDEVENMLKDTYEAFKVLREQQNKAKMN